MLYKISKYDAKSVCLVQFLIRKADFDTRNLMRVKYNPILISTHTTIDVYCQQQLDTYV